MDSVINDYIGREIVQDPVLLLPENFDDVNTGCACLRARKPTRQRAAHG